MNKMSFWIKNEEELIEFILPILGSEFANNKPASYPALYLFNYSNGKTDTIEAQLTIYTKEDFLEEGVQVDNDGRINFNYGNKAVAHASN